MKQIIYQIGFYLFIFAFLFFMNKLRYLYPVNAEDKELACDGDKSLYNRWYIFSIIIIVSTMILLMYPLSIIIGFLYKILYDNLLLKFDGYVWIIHINYYYILGIFILVPIATLLEYIIIKLKFKDKYKNFIAYTNIMQNMDGKKLTRLLTRFIVSLAIILTILGINYYIVFKDDAIIDNKFLSLKNEVFYYEDIQQIYKVSNYFWFGEVKENEFYVILFNDNRLLNLRDKHFDIEEFEKTILSNIINKTNVEITYIDFIEDINNIN